VFTSTNPADDPNVSLSSMHDLCTNGLDSSPVNNCNIYAQKAYVWLTGGPASAALSDGIYVFAVLDPSGQGDPNECAAENLSDACNGGGGDVWSHRVFSISGGVITYPAAGFPGGHDYDGARHMVRLLPYDNTSNPGGEYVFSACSIGAVDPNGPAPVLDPSQCKYDNFKVREGCTEDCGGTPQDATLTTEVHLADHTVIDGSSTLYLSAFGTLSVHDKAIVTFGGGGSLPDGSSVVFYFFGNSSCTGTPLGGPDSHSISGASPASFDGGLPETISLPGSYGYKAFFYSGDLTLVTDAEGVCEPFSIAGQLGKTMGFWGNTNGVAYITGHGGYSGNATGIGRGSNIDTQQEALKVLPSTLNACGSGSPSIYTVGAATTTNPLKNCTLASGISLGAFNTNAGQILALHYNINLVPTFTGQSIGALGCSAYLTAGLTALNSVNDAFAAAVTLVDHSASGGSTTQSAIGAMNLLLNCLNRES